MTNWQRHPGSLQIGVAEPDGVYLLVKDGVRFSAFGRLIDGTSTTIVINGDGTIQIDSAASAAVPLTTDINDVPDFVWDENNELVLTEYPT